MADARATANFQSKRVEWIGKRNLGQVSAVVGVAAIGQSSNSLQGGASTTGQLDGAEGILGLVG